MIIKRSRLFLIIFVFTAFSVNADGPPPVMVQVDEAVSMEIAPFVWVTGTVIGRFDSRIAAEVEGNLLEIMDVGDIVNEGDVIARVDDSSYRLAVNEVEAEIKPIETMVAFYQRESDRLEKLAMQNNAAKNLLDETQAKRDEALAKIRAVKARLAMSRDSLNKTRILAPFKGVIVERNKTPGERVEAGDQIVRLVDTEMLEIQAHIQQQSFAYVKAGNKLKVRGSSEQSQGEVRTVIPVGDDLSRLYEIRIQFENDNWPAGKAVDVAVPVKDEEEVIAVPRDALVIRQSGIVVYRIGDNNMAELVPVKTGIANTSHIQVIGDIKAGDKVVIRGNERLRPGQIVQIISG
ncbi:MAG: efflux RND transporter periplasmic adaptor subunit [Proteobacteria bacterium]|nr:efflux RND transporter periplasmic adaptor subunit [Pseudomonadota bacterium]